jgi:hypothetical protein
LDPPYRADDLETAFIQDELTLTGGKVRVIGGTKLEHTTPTRGSRPNRAFARSGE